MNMVSYYLIQVCNVFSYNIVLDIDYVFQRGGRCFTHVLNNDNIFYVSCV